MRIIGGEFGGRRFYPPADKWPTRPTTDVAKEGLFNILQNRFDFADIRFLDLFGGTGSHSIEAISRGCTDATYVDKFKGCVRFVHSLTSELEISDKIHINQYDAFRYCRKKGIGQFGYIYAGPPYPLPTLENIPDLIFTNDLLAPQGLFVLEHDQTNSFTEHPCFTEIRKYGLCHFSLFKNEDQLV
jgi:16S rRNA (guanine(966)-N(2))-methyltransferase RsmD